jgi:vacuolar-type H+-ATPase subunit H
MDELSAVKSWESKLRQDIEDLKTNKEKVMSDSSIPKSVKDRFLDVMRSLKMSMVQVMSKCSQLRSESLPSKALKVRIEKLRFEYEEVKKSLFQLMQTIEPKPPLNIKKTSRSSSKVFSQVSFSEEVPAVLSKELDDICGIIQKAQEHLEEHRHSEYEQRMEVLEVENQELRRNLARIQSENSEVFELITLLKGRLERLEGENGSQKEIKDIPKRRVLLQPSSHAEALLRNNF